MNSSRDTKNPTGGVNSRRDDMQPASSNNLLERILSRENMIIAWNKVKANKGASGYDRMTIKEFPAYLKSHWIEIRSSLMEGRYSPSPVLRVEIPKPTGGLRPLGIPIVLDRTIQQAIYQVLSPMFEPVFSEYSYGFRPNRSAHQAVKQLQTYKMQGYKVAVDCDLSKFFDRVNHDILMSKVVKRVKDKRVLRLIGLYLRAGVIIDGKVYPTKEGVPQGGPLSPLLANIMLDDLDKELERRKHRFARYADDFTILVKSQRAGERVMQSISHFLEKELKLIVNTTKSKVVLLEESQFLGFIFKGKQIRWSEESFIEFKRRIRLATGRSWGVSMEYRFKKLSEYIRGWMNYFGISEYYSPIPEIDSWIRRRVRMCYMKQWRRPRTRIRNLVKLGVGLKESIDIGLSRKGYWRLAKTYATQLGMTNKWLKEQGLVSVREMWIARHYPK